LDSIDTQSYYLQAILQIDFNFATECDTDTGKTLLHIAASSGAMNTTKVTGYYGLFTTSKNHAYSSNVHPIDSVEQQTCFVNVCSQLTMKEKRL